MTFETHIRAAEIHLSANEYRACHEHCIAAIKIDPTRPDPLYLLGILTSEHQNFTKALELFDRAQKMDAKNPKIHAQKAKCQSSMGLQQDAADSVNLAITAKPSDDFTLDTIGVVLTRIGRHADALPFFRRCVAQSPKNANYQYNLGSALQFTGDFEEAEMALRKSLSLNPNDFRSYTSLAALRKQDRKNNHIEVMSELFSKSQDPDARLQLGHALAKTCEDLGIYEDALNWLIRGKEGKRSELNYSFGEHERLFDAAEKLEYSEPQNQQIKQDTTPIFIVGMPRTGTTLVDRIISSHPDAISMGELSNFGTHLKTATRTKSRFVLDAETLGQASSVDLSKIGEQYLASTLRLRGAHPVFIDKMPLNFFYGPLLLTALPTARIIVLRRHPMDACLSNYRQLFRTSYSYYNYAFDLSDIARFYGRFDQLISQWLKALPPDRFMQIHYEDIVHNQDEETRKIISYCGLDWDEACLNFHNNKAPVATASSVQVRKPLYSSSIGRWKKYGESIAALHDELVNQGVDIA